MTTPRPTPGRAPRPTAPRTTALRAVPLAAVALAAACAKDPVLVDVTSPASAPFMARYVAIGNSITAGYQSAGINDSTQRRSYPRLLAIAAGVGKTFAYPALAMPGCPPPIVNFLTGVRVGGDTSSTTCLARDPASLTASLNNVAVPGANSFDVVGRGLTATSATSLTLGGYNPLTLFILGGKTQLQRAVQLDPTFATVWVGNNDVLAAALQFAGDTTKATSLKDFTSNYAALVNGLKGGSPNLKGGVLIGVVDVTNTPILVPLAVFNPNVPGFSPAAYGAVLQGLFKVGVPGGRPATFQLNFDASCTNSLAAIAFPALAGLAAAIPAAAPGYTFVCADGPFQTPNLVSDKERAFFSARVAAYNAYISAKADSIGWAYFDPNPALLTLRAQGAIPYFPNLAAPEAPFATAAGRFISNDGVHPSTSAHYLIANLLIQTINTKYKSSIRALTPADTVGL